MRARVLVTRPEPGATATAERLEALGFEPVKLSLQETRGLAVDLAAIPEHIAAIAIPSASAIRHAPRDLVAKWAGLPCLAVGEATASAAREAGFADVTLGEGDAESLAEIIIAGRPAGPVAYLCGKVRRPVFEERLAGAGIRVAVVETYDTLPVNLHAASITGAAGGRPVDYALVYSANAAELLAERMKAEELRGLFESTTMVCISARVAEALTGLGGKILVAGEPSETALLKALQDAVKPAS